MQLAINTYGEYLAPQGSLFQIKADGKTTKVLARRVRAIMDEVLTLEGI